MVRLRFARPQIVKIRLHVIEVGVRFFALLSRAAAHMFGHPGCRVCVFNLHFDVIAGVEIEAAVDVRIAGTGVRIDIVPEDFPC